MWTSANVLFAIAVSMISSSALAQGCASVNPLEGNVSETDYGILTDEVGDEYIFSLQSGGVLLAKAGREMYDFCVQYRMTNSSPSPIRQVFSKQAHFNFVTIGSNEGFSSAKFPVKSCSDRSFYSLYPVGAFRNSEKMVDMATVQSPSNDTGNCKFRSAQGVGFLDISEKLEGVQNLLTKYKIPTESVVAFSVNEEQSYPPIESEIVSNSVFLSTISSVKYYPDDRSISFSIDVSTSGEETLVSEFLKIPLPSLKSYKGVSQLVELSLNGLPLSKANFKLGSYSWNQSILVGDDYVDPVIFITKQAITIKNGENVSCFVVPVYSPTPISLSDQEYCLIEE